MARTKRKTKSRRTKRTAKRTSKRKTARKSARRSRTARNKRSSGKDVHIVKRRGHLEVFDERKVYATCFSACLASHVDTRLAEDISDIVTDYVKKWIKNKREVTSTQVSKVITQKLRSLEKDVAFMYETHRDVN